MSILQPRRLALVFLATVAAAPALAGGFAEAVVTPVVTPVAVTPVVVAPSGEWTGGFIGAQLGFGNVTVDEFLGDPGDLDVDGSGALFGLNAGYNRDFGRFVLGGEVQFDSAGIDIEADGAETGLEVDSIFRTGVRAGYDAGRFMPYVTGGYASASVDGVGADTDLTGGYLGAGVDYQLSDRITLGGQVLQHNFDESDTDGLGTLDADVDATTVHLRATYNF